jgi:hypothetical protein
MLLGDSKVGGDRHDPTTKAGKEESRAVGLGKYEGRPSENSIRAEHGRQLRTQYNAIPESSPQEPVTFTRRSEDL